MTSESIVLDITGELGVAMNGDDDCNMELESGRRGRWEDVRDIAVAARRSLECTRSNGSTHKSRATYERGCYRSG
jgi:hypothetical protein